jgi:excisionase family DNA binding protein
MLELLSTSAQAALVRLIDERVAERVEDILGPAARKTDASPWFTVTEAADYLRTTPGAIYKRIERGQLPSYRPEGSQTLLHRADLDGAGPRTREVL